MYIFTVFFLFILGIVLIIKFGDVFVEASIKIAKLSHIPNFIIGATVVSLATTLPEIFVSIIAASRGNVSMSCANAVGSVTANTGLILAMSVAVAPFAISRKKFLPKAILLLLSICILMYFTGGDKLTIFGSLGMLIIFIMFIIENTVDAKKSAKSIQSIEKTKASAKDKIKIIAGFVLGAGGIIIGSHLMVENGIVIAHDILKIDERIVSLTAIAIGTSLPELITSISALRKKQGSLSAGNVIGANIIDLSLILPLSSFVYGGDLPMTGDTHSTDLPVLLGIAAIMIIPTIFTGKFTRKQGIFALISYIIYVIYIILF